MSKRIITLTFFVLTIISSVFAQGETEMQIAGRLFVNWNRAGDMEVVVRDDFAFVALDRGGIHILDISNPRNPQIVWYNDTDFPRTKSPVICDNHLIFITTQEVVVLDISNPTQPNITCRLAEDRWSDYIAATSFGVAISSPLRLYNIDDMGQLIEASRFDSSAWCITVDNDVLYAVGRRDIDEDNHTRVIRAIDIQNPANPQEIGSIPVDREIIDMCAENGIIYTIAERNEVLRIIDATNPAEMSEISRVGNWYEPTSIAHTDGLLFMTNVRGRMHTINVAQPEEPVLLSSYIHGCHGVDALDVTAQGSHAFVVGNGKLGMVDVSNPETPTSLGVYDGNGRVSTVKSHGRYALAQDKEGDPHDDNGIIRIVDVADIHQPVPMGRCNILGEIYSETDMCVKNNFLLVLKPFGCDVFDIINVNRPTLAASWENEEPEEGGDPLSYSGIESTDGDYIFLRTPQGFETLRASRLPRLSRRLIDVPEEENNFGSFKIHNNHAYCLDGSGFRVFEISEHNEFQTVALLELVIYGLGVFNLSMNPEGNLVCMTDWKNCWLIDVSDPLNPEVLTEDLNARTGASIYGDYLLTNWLEGVSLYDISNPREPALLTDYQTPSLRAESIELCDGYAMIGDRSSMIILEIIHPEKAGDPMRLIPSRQNLTSHPNPFNSTTIINYSIPSPEYLSIKLFDTSGRELRMIYEGFQTAGLHSITLDGSDLPTGSYLIRMEAGEFQSTRKVELLR